MSDKSCEQLTQESKSALLESINKLITTHENVLYAKDLNNLSQALFYLNSMKD